MSRKLKKLETYLALYITIVTDRQPDMQNYAR